MPVVTRCIHCRRQAQVQDQFAEKPVRCPHCQQVFVARRDSGEPPTHLSMPAKSVAASTNGATAAPSAVSPPVARPANGAVVSANTANLTSSIFLTAVTTGPVTCPACKAKLAAGATVCHECGWVRFLPGSGGEGNETQPLICLNPACGVANPPTERYCQRCNTMLPSAPGTTLRGRYKIRELLAIGGFGAVYLADDVVANRKVAIKDMICADSNEFKIRLQFFQREAEILKLLEQSPIAPRFYDFIQEGQSAHLVMEFIPGRDLLKVLESQNNRPLPPDKVVEWAKQVCDVLTLLHQQNPPIVHRDLKPDNIMLLEDGKSIKLIDFGTARDLGKSAKTRLAAKTRVYTEGYAPPEQIIGKPEVRSDLFALAGTMYHLLTGKAPEGHYTAVEIQEQLQQPGVIPQGLHWLYEILRANLAEDVNERYYSARQFKQDLSQRQISTQAPCPVCRQMNQVRQVYCNRCASPLTDPIPPCNSCGRVNYIGCRFCTQCGNRLR
jgi:tRNA A-37 threonylcarbamoyl transferase component Bud32